MAKEPEQPVREEQSTGALLREAANVLVTIAGIAVAVFLLWRPDPPGPLEPKRYMEVGADPFDQEECGEVAADGKPVLVSMIYSPHKKAWIEHAADVFARRCKNVRLKLTEMESMAAVSALLDGQEPIPTVWSPTTSLAVRYLEARWQERSKESPVHGQSSLVRSPLVLMVWEDRGDVLKAVLGADETDDGTWMKIACPSIPRETMSAAKLAREPARSAATRGARGRWATWAAQVLPDPEKLSALSARKRPGEKEKAPEEPKHLPSRAEIESWGRIKMVHAMPSRSDAGLDALYLMAYDYLLPPSERRSADGQPASRDRLAQNGPVAGSDHLRDDLATRLSEQGDSLLGWLRRCEADLEEPPQTTSVLASAMFALGPSEYDGVMTYENLAFPILDRIDNHEADLKAVTIVYPATTIVSDHPAVILRADSPETAAERKAADKWIQFLRGRKMQRKAIEYGFRPADPKMAVADEDDDRNPFLKMRRYGVKLSPALTEPPHLEGAAVRRIIDLWEEATGRN